jgi:hypothetical protein
MADTLINAGSSNATQAQPQQATSNGTAVSAVTKANVNLAIRKRALRQIAVGFGILVVGVIVTAVTYHIASNSQSGGTYLVLWGPMAIGALTIFRGFRTLFSSKKFS